MARYLLIGLLSLFCTFAPASAQEQNLVLQHYRAYRAALDAGDLASAESAAIEALAASVGRDGDRGRTAVLALNLATVRLMRSNYEGARAPASQAARILGQLGPDANIDPVMAELVLGRAELGSGSQDEGAARLLAALPRVAVDSDLVGDGHAAAFELAVWLFQRERYADARIAWAEVGRLATGSPTGAEYARARAQTFEAASLFMAAISDRSRRLRTEEALEIDRRLRDAMVALEPLASQVGDGGAMTLAQQAYAEAIVWRSVLRVQMGNNAVERVQRQSEDRNFEEEWHGAEYGAQQIEAPSGDVALPTCRVRLRPRPLPDYPSRALNNLYVGALVIRLQFNEAGEVVDRRIAASVGGDGFERSVGAVLPRWEVSIDGAQPPNCRMPIAQLVTIRFQMYD